LPAQLPNLSSQGFDFGLVLLFQSQDLRLQPLKRPGILSV
jgi:hypothetical protein